MTIDEFQNALRTLLNDADQSGLHRDEVLAIVDEELPAGFYIAGDAALNIQQRGSDD